MPSRSVLRCGDPATEILAVIAELKPELVVTGTRARKGLAHLLLGTVVENVMRASPSPVLTVHAKAS